MLFYINFLPLTIFSENIFKIINTNLINHHLVQDKNKIEKTEKKQKLGYVPKFIGWSLFLICAIVCGTENFTEFTMFFEKKSRKIYFQFKLNSTFKLGNYQSLS